MQHLTIHEVKSLVNEINDPDNKTMILVGFWHGLRVSELINLQGGDIKDGFVSVQRLKGSMKTIQPYVVHPDPALDESKGLKHLADTVGHQTRIFRMTTRYGVYKLIQRAGKKAGIAEHKLHPHVLKHSIAMFSIKKAGIENVRQYLGHKSIASTGAYLKVTDDEASAAILNVIED
jgi:integrase